jgi:hypothetical protein
MSRKYYEYDFASVVTLAKVNPIAVYRDMHILFRMAMTSLGKVIFWKDSDGSEWCACWDAKAQHMHSDLYREEYKTLIVSEVNPKI